MDSNHLLTLSLRSFPIRNSITRIISEALKAVDPCTAVRRYVNRDRDILTVADQNYSLGSINRIRIIGAGKAVFPMASACAEILGTDLTDGIIIVKDGYIDAQRQGNTWERLRAVEAGHPIPDFRGLQGTRSIMEMVKDSRPDDLVICLLSGGGSALLTAPFDELTLDDIQILTGRLLTSGASIHEINTLRKHLDKIKGGRLAAMVYPARLVCLILSDVVGDTLDIIASGPTCPDSSSYSESYSILKKYELLDQLPESIPSILLEGMDGNLPETPKPGDSIFEGVQNVLVGSNQVAAQAALDQASRDGLNGILLTTSLQGEARSVGQFLSSIVHQLASYNQPVSAPACVILGGETTVRVTGNGSGGRNQELALSMVESIANLPDTLIITLATDGGDGLTDAAGAVITGETYRRAIQAGMNPSIYLDRNDSYNFFDRLDDLIRTGPTMTNVNDLIFIFVLKTKRATNLQRWQ
jgi:hydroxypyruvate reductase